MKLYSYIICCIYRNIVQYCAWYNHSIRIRYNAYRHTGTCILSACFISRGATFSKSGQHGRGDWLDPFSAPCASLSSFLKRTATITQACAGSQALRSGTVAFKLCHAPLMSRIYRAAIPSLFLRFVVIMKRTVLENVIVLISKKCTYFGLASLFHLIFSNILLPCISSVI